MVDEHAPISTSKPLKEQPIVKKRAVGEAHLEKTTTGLKEKKREKRGAVKSSTKKTCKQRGPNQTQPTKRGRRRGKTKAKMSHSPTPSRPKTPWVHLPPNKNML
ncbi:hypothetical protein V6N13_099276 [Hibiscus sabdariffa]|uniref:Uncharacterized protein n=1 Tax=Hibiscus sabdariffa TaxID=183260 RepID=A0ABR2PZU8_9ROSI